MATFTTKQYIKKLDQAMLEMQDEKWHIAIVAEIIRRQQKRIFDNSTDSTGKPIGTYSQEPIYVSMRTDKTPKQLKPIGKKPKKGRARSTFKNGKLHTSRYFEFGYMQYKKAIGKGGGGKVNLWLFGHFRTAFMNMIGTETIQVSKTKIRILTKITASELNPQGKIDGLYDKYPLAFKLSESERNYAKEKGQEFLIELLK